MDDDTTTGDAMDQGRNLNLHNDLTRDTSSQSNRSSKSSRSKHASLHFRKVPSKSAITRASTARQGLNIGKRSHPASSTSQSSSGELSLAKDVSSPQVLQSGDQDEPKILTISNPSIGHPNDTEVTTAITSTPTQGNMLSGDPLFSEIGRAHV